LLTANPAYRHLGKTKELEEALLPVGGSEQRLVLAVGRNEHVSA
jgi:hypothetical protein